MDVHLLLGGARSGKSSTAERLVRSRDVAPVYLATALVDPTDTEFVERVAQHRADRGADWTTVEEPRDLVGALRRHRRPGAGVVVDCLTLWLSTLLAEERDPTAEVEAICAELAQQADFIQALVKAALFGYLAAAIACHYGYNAFGGPKAVGDAVNRAVVLTFIVLFFVNFTLTAMYFNLVPPKA